MVPENGFPGRVPTSVALALLESLRDVDTPSDPGALTETDLPLVLQRRLGLSGVVVDQIRRYANRPRGDLPAAEVASLFALIGRRDDAARIFVEAGQRIARDALEARGLPARVGLRMLPRALRERRALERVRHLARTVSPGGRVLLQRRPHALIVERALPAAAAEGGVGCALLEGAIQYVLLDYRVGGFRIVHSRCEGQDEARCEWVLETADEETLLPERAVPGGDPEGERPGPVPEGNRPESDPEEGRPGSHPGDARPRSRESGDGSETVHAEPAAGG